MFDNPKLTLQISTSPNTAPQTIEGSTVGISLTDAEGTFLQSNATFCEFLGYPLHELLGKSVVEITHPEDRHRTLETFQHLRTRGDRNRTYEKRYLRKDGSTVWGLTTVNRLGADTSEDTPRFVGFVHDITRQKEVQSSLHFTKNLYQGLVENVGVGLSRVDRNHRIQMVNSTLAGILGKKPQELVGKYCFCEFETKTDVCPHCPGVTAMRTGQSETVITNGVLPNGTRFKVRIKAFPVIEADGETSGFVELIEDLSGWQEMEFALHESEERFKTLAETAPIGIFEVSPTGMNTYSNPAWVSMSGLSAEDTLGAGWTEAIPPEDREEVRKSWQEAKRTGLPWQKEHRLRHRNGDLRWVQATAVPVCRPEGELVRYVGTVVDLTGQKRAMERLEESEERFRSIFEKSGVGMKVIGPDGRILDANPAFCSLVGYSLNELKSMNIRSLIQLEAPGQTDRIWNAFVGNESHVTFEQDFIRSDGATVWGEVTGVWIPGGMDGRGFGVGIIQDITKKKEAQERLEYLNFYDDLTGLPNRKLLGDRLGHAVAKAKRRNTRVGVLLIGLDRLGKIVATFDHETGNQILYQVAGRLREIVRQTDTLSRLGDTEFAILLEDVENLKATGVVAQNVLRKVAEPVQVRNRSFHVTASVGISLFPEDGEDTEGLLRAANAAMGRAKQQGGDLFEYFIPNLNVRTREILGLEADLCKALKSEEFVLHYQPQMALKTRSLAGFEALVRWQHPERGLVPPGDFIPLAEETGVIVPLGEWVLREACRQNREWQQAGLAPVRIAVNLSARQFRRVDLPDLVRQVLGDTGLAPEYLELEITESMVMEEVDRAIGIMKKLADMGVHLAIDDFGSGYSSLLYLKSFPVKRLKVDRNFVRDVLTDANDAAIASAVMALAKTMNLEVVAEGIETEEQMTFFLEKNCDFCQGYYFSRPLEPALAREFLVKRG